MRQASAFGIDFGLAWLPFRLQVAFMPLEVEWIQILPGSVAILAQAALAQAILTKLVAVSEPLSL